MIAIQISINIALLGGLIIGAMVAGFALRSVQLKKLRYKVSELEKEMLANHAEILDLQKEKVEQDQKSKNLSLPVIPVIPMNITADDKSEKMPDASLRKKMFTPKPAHK
jgi:hypothetical protein